MEYRKQGSFIAGVELDMFKGILDSETMKYFAGGLGVMRCQQSR